MLLNLNNILSNSQFGFVPNRSITDHMLHFFSTFNSALSQNVGIHTIYFDLSKDFDTVSHPKLIYKLNKIGLHYDIVCLIQNYLCIRKFMFVLIM